MEREAMLELIDACEAIRRTYILKSLTRRIGQSPKSFQGFPIEMDPADDLAVRLEYWDDHPLIPWPSSRQNLQIFSFKNTWDIETRLLGFTNAPRNLKVALVLGKMSLSNLLRASGGDGFEFFTEEDRGFVELAQEFDEAIEAGIQNILSEMGVG